MVEFLVILGVVFSIFSVDFFVKVLMVSSAINHKKFSYTLLVFLLLAETLVGSTIITMILFTAHYGNL